MKKRVVRIFAGVLAGILIVCGAIWLLSAALGDHQTSYSGKTMYAWARQLNNSDAGASNQAFQVLNTQIIPRLVDQMFHDTNDSKLKLSLIELLNGIPRVRIHFTEATGRRADAIRTLGTFGPPAKAAVPSLIQALKDPEAGIQECVIQSLGHIHSDANIVVPLLIPYLTNDDLNDDAAAALGNYDGLAREAFPKIVPLLSAKDHEVRDAARAALKKIDPEAAAKAGVK